MSNHLRLDDTKQSNLSPGQQAIPKGVRLSAAILVLFGCAFTLTAIFFLYATAFSSLNGGKGSLNIIFASLSVLLTAAAAVCLKTARALYEMRNWAVNVATALGGLSVAFCGLWLFDTFVSRKAGPDDYFLYPVIPLLLPAGAVLCVYLNLRRVRMLFRKHTE